MPHAKPATKKSWATATMIAKEAQDRFQQATVAWVAVQKHHEYGFKQKRIEAEVLFHRLVCEGWIRADMAFQAIVGAMECRYLFSYEGGPNIPTWQMQTVLPSIFLNKTTKHCNAEKNVAALPWFTCTTEFTTLDTHSEQYRSAAVVALDLGDRFSGEVQTFIKKGDALEAGKPVVLHSTTGTTYQLAAVRY